MSRILGGEREDGHVSNEGMIRVLRERENRGGDGTTGGDEGGLRGGCWVVVEREEGVARYGERSKVSGRTREGNLRSG